MHRPTGKLPPDDVFRISEAARLKPCPKHPPKVHVWDGISARGAMNMVMFSGIMNATRYTNILALD